MVSGTLRRSLRSETDKDLNTAPRLRVRASSARWLTLCGSLAASSSGHPSETAVVIEPSKPEEVAWLNVAAYGLIPWEEEVVKFIVRGASTRQIAASLYISEYTVQNHISNVFEKVGARSHRALVNASSSTASTLRCSGNRSLGVPRKPRAPSG